MAQGGHEKVGEVTSLFTSVGQLPVTNLDLQFKNINLL